MTSLKRELSRPRVQTLLFFFLVFIVSYQFIKPRESSKDIEIVGNRAYLASGSAGIDVLDISDPGNPRSIGSYDTQGSANQIAISEDYLFVADGNDGLLILDISDPANVHQIGRFDTPGNAEDVAFKGKNIFIADGRTGLIGINVSDPANPQALSEDPLFETQGQATRIVIDGNLGYIADTRNNVSIIDISNPATPNYVSNYQAPAEVSGIVVVNNRGYLAAEQSGLIILNVENPAAPEQIAIYDTPGISKSIAISGNYAYIADGRAGIRILEINNPPNIAEVGHFSEVIEANDIAVKDKYIYLADGYEGLRVLDQNLNISFEMVSPSNLPGNAEDVAVQDKYAFLASESQGIRVLDTSNPQQPFEVGLYDTPGQAVGVTTAGDYIYVADREGDLRILFISGSDAGTVELAEKSHLDLPGETFDILVDGKIGYVAAGNGGLRIINLEDPGAPKEVGAEERAANAMSMAVLGDYAYVTGGANGLYVVNITDRTKPAVIGYIDSPGEARAVSVIKTTSGTERIFALVADGDGGIRVVEVTNPRQPTEVGTNTAPEFAYDLSVVGNLAYISGRNDGLWVMDITDPTTPKEIGFYDSPGKAHGIDVLGANVFIADYDRGMRIVDVTTPTAPVPVGFYDVPRQVSDVLVNEYAYLVDRGRGLRVEDVNDPNAMREVGFYDSPGQAQGLFIQGNYAYLGVESNLKILDISKPTTPDETGSFGIPAPVTAVHVSGDYAYVANGAGGLRIVNIKDPALPGSAGTYDTPGNALDVAKSGNYAYIADGGKGFSIANVSDPNRPQTASLLNQFTDSRSVIVLGNNAYLADGINGVYTINVEKPAAPEQVSALDTPGIAQDLAATDNFLFIADGQGGIQVVYILHPDHLTAVGSTQPAGESIALDVVPKVIKKGEPQHFYVYLASNELGLRIFDASQAFKPIQIGLYSTPGVYPLGRTIQEAIPSTIAFLLGQGEKVPDKFWRSMLLYTFDILVFTVTMLFWLGFVSQFVLPVTTIDERLQAVGRLFNYMIGRSGPAVYIKGGRIYNAQGTTEPEMINDTKKIKPGVLMVDASSAVFLKESSPSNTILVQGPGLHFINNRRILGTVDLRRQLRVRKSARGFSRDGIEVQTNVATVFTIGEKPDVLPVCYDGAEIPANLRVIHLRTEGLSQFITELVDELEADDKVDIHNFILANMDPMEPYNLPPEIVPGPPYTIDETRIFAAVSSRAQNVAEKNILDWTELPVYAAVGLFRNMLAQELYDNLYLPKEPETYPLAYMKGNFSIKVRNLGILSYQYVKREDGEKLAPGQIWNPAALNSYPAQNLQSPKVLRARGIKVISAGFSDLEPTSDKVKELLMQRWSANWEKEATVVTADYELQALRILNLARAQAQGEMVGVLSLILGETPMSEAAMAVRVFQALETAAADPKTRQLLPAETITMMQNLHDWLLPPASPTLPPSGPVLPPSGPALPSASTALPSSVTVLPPSGPALPSTSTTLPSSVTALPLTVPALPPVSAVLTPVATTLPSVPAVPAPVPALPSSGTTPPPGVAIPTPTMEQRINDFFNNGQWWGYFRLLFVLALLIVFMYIGRIGFEKIDATTVIDDWQSNFPILIVVPDFLLKIWVLLFSGRNFRYLFLPLSALLGALFFGSRYIQGTYLIQKFWTNVHYLLAALFAISYPHLTVSKGKLETKPGEINLLQVIGGPGKLDVKPGNLVLLENLPGEPQVLPEGKHYINQLEKIKETVSLDDQHGSIEEVKGRSKDGIPIRVVEVSFQYRLVTGSTRTPAIPYPFSESAFKGMAYNRNISRDDGITPWHTAVTGAVEGAIREYVNQHQFDHLTAPNFLEGEPREGILIKVNSPPTVKRLLSLGAELLWVSIGHFDIEDDVKDQRLKTWGAKWVGDATVVKAYGEAQRLIYQEIGRAEGQAEIIMSIINALNATTLVGAPVANIRHIVLMRTAQILEALAQPPKSLPPPKIERKRPRRPRQPRQP